MRYIYGSRDDGLRYKSKEKDDIDLTGSSDSLGLVTLIGAVAAKHANMPRDTSTHCIAAVPLLCSATVSVIFGGNGR